MRFTIDIELTNRCNAKCNFCPRDQTPHQGVMSEEVFAQSLLRAQEYRSLSLDLFNDETVVSLCGLGEPLLNRHAPEFARQVRAAGFEVSMSSNAALLDEERGRALLDAGLQNIYINVGDEGSDYEDVYRLPFERTRENIVRFAEMAGDQCAVMIVLVDYKRDRDHVNRMEEYWRSYGINRFLRYDIMNRGGALFVDHMQFETYAQLTKARELLDARGAAVPHCGAPFGYLFIGYDGQYYLCCSDWKKETPMGSVFDESFLSVAQKKLEYVTSREPVCKTCNEDPLNQLTDELRARDAGEYADLTVDEIVDRLIERHAVGREVAQAMVARATSDASTSTSRRRIPLIAENA